MPRPLATGIYAPLPVFFTADDELDLDSYAKHVLYTAKAGVVPVISGSMGEAVHLSHSERTKLIRAARAALDGAGLTDMPIMAGAGAASTKEAIQLAVEAAEAGADHVIVISPGYYAGAMIKDDFAATKQYFIDVAAGSPLPVMMYNFPAVTGGIDMNSDVIEEIAKAAPNVCGIKLTCGAVGKITRISTLSNGPGFAEKYPRKDASAPFIILAGFIDILLPAVTAGAVGTITGVANFAPNACMKFMKLCQAEPSPETMKEAQRLQGIIARADGAANSIGIPGMKYALHKMFGYPVEPRRPFLPTPAELGDAYLGCDDIVACLELEKQCIAESS